MVQRHAERLRSVLRHDGRPAAFTEPLVLVVNVYARARMRSVSVNAVPPDGKHGVGPLEHPGARRAATC